MENLICPICGHKDAYDSTMPGNMICNQCGYVNETAAFYEQDFEALRGYVVEVPEPLNMQVHLQLGITNERAEEILKAAVDYIESPDVAGMLFISHGLVYSHAAKHCKTPAELICMVNLVHQYLKRMGYQRITDATE